jgi:hypothetical protein
MATQRMTMNGKTMFRDGTDEKPMREKPGTKKKGSDGKQCWDGYRYGGTVNGRDICTKMKK